MKSYDRNERRVDHFWFELTNEHKCYNFQNLIKLLLTFSHGNANLERGFSINKECLVENLEEKSLVAQRSIYDAVAVVFMRLKLQKK